MRIGRKGGRPGLIYARLFLEFFRAGLFAVGGGLATIPFLFDIGARTGWYSAADLTNMIAVSESTPGPLGVNMASYVGFSVAGVPGCVVATLGLVAPCYLCILIVIRMLRQFQGNRKVDSVFYGLRPASTAMIAAAGIGVAELSLFSLDLFQTTGRPVDLVQWKALALAAVLLVCTRCWKKVHPVVWIALSAGAGILFQM